MSDDYLTKAPISITEQHETFVRKDGSTYTRKDIFVKLYVTFRDAMLAQLKGPRLSVYLCIALHCGEDMTSYPSFKTIGRESGYGRRAVISAVNDLVAMNLVERRGRWTEKGDPDSNLYTVKGYIGMGGSASNALPGAPDAPGVVNGGAPKEEPIEEEPIEKRETDFPSLTLSFGQYKGQTLKQVLEQGDTGYLSWLAGKEGIPTAVRDAAQHLIDGLGGPGRWTQAELEKARAESLAETPIDADEYLREDV